MRIVHQSMAAAIVLSVAACAVQGSRSSATDEWLRTRAEENCSRASCLFAVLVDTAGQPIEGADVELGGTDRRGVSNAWGRVVVQGAPLGSHRLKVRVNGATMESEPVALPPTYLAVTIEVRPEGLTVRR